MGHNETTPRTDLVKLTQKLKLSTEVAEGFIDTVSAIILTVATRGPKNFDEQKTFSKAAPYTLNQIEKGFNKENNTITLDNITYNIRPKPKAIAPGHKLEKDFETDPSDTKVRIRQEFLSQFAAKADPGLVYELSRGYFSMPQIAILDKDSSVKLFSAIAYDKEGRLQPSAEYKHQIAISKENQQQAGSINTPSQVPESVKSTFINLKGGVHHNSAELVPLQTLPDSTQQKPLQSTSQPNKKAGKDF